MADEDLEDEIEEYPGYLLSNTILSGQLGSVGNGYILPDMVSVEYAPEVFFGLEGHALTHDRLELSEDVFWSDGVILGQNDIEGIALEITDEIYKFFGTIDEKETDSGIDPQYEGHLVDDSLVLGQYASEVFFGLEGHYITIDHLDLGRDLWWSHGDILEPEDAGPAKSFKYDDYTVDPRAYPLDYAYAEKED
jgi:hypothetical protein